MKEDDTQIFYKPTLTVYHHIHSGEISSITIDVTFPEYSKQRPFILESCTKRLVNGTIVSRNFTIASYEISFVDLPYVKKVCVLRCSALVYRSTDNAVKMKQSDINTNIEIV